MQNQELVRKIVVAFVGNNPVTPDELPGVISSTHDMLVKLTRDKPQKEPAVPIKKSVTDDYITCLECGKHMKMIKRHLRDCHDTNPDEYRERWGLGPTYPMVAPNYAKRRAELAVEIGLGRGRISKT